jgi:GT2 family glycosyltransferase
VAVVVTRNPGPFLERALGALAAQDYPDLAVLVVDTGSRVDPTARVAAALPGAFVRVVDPGAGFGGAANEALGAVKGASFFLVCHDDVALDPSAVRLLVEEAFRSNAGVVGPKLVSAEDPDVLLEVGRAIDRLGGSHTGIEPGEVDQEQHDSVRDVFYVSSAAMLVRADLFTELGGFDAATFPGSEDLDLCWRARLAGARVMVVPDARGTHREASRERSPEDLPDARDVARKRVRVLLTCYSLATLVWVVPVGLMLSLAEVVFYLPTSRRRLAFASFGAWWWNALHAGQLRGSRRRAQALRSIGDAELRELQVGPSARFGAFLTQHHAEERLQAIGERSRDVVSSVTDALRHPASIAFAVFALLLVVGSRTILSSGVPDFGTLVEWPGVRSMADAFGSAWRYTGMGSTTAPPPALVMTSALGTVLFGSVGLARTLVVVGAFAIGAAGAYRLARTIGVGYGVAVVTSLAYGANPVPRNAIAHGRLGPLVLFALLPYLVALLLRCGEFRELAAIGKRPLLGLVLVTAVAGAWYPPALLVPASVGLVLLVTSALTGGSAAAARATGAALAAAAGAALLLAPWSASFADVGDDPAAFGIALRPHLDLWQVLRFQSGPAGAGVASWGLLVAALAALALARGSRLTWAVRAWGLVVAGFALVYLPARFAPGAAVAAPEAGLAIAALGAAVAAGIGVGTLVDEMRGARATDWRRGVSLAACAGVVLLGLGFAADAIDGRWHAPDHTWAETLAFTSDRQFEGGFRVLWLGDAAALPLDPIEVRGSLSYVLTRNGPGDGRELWRAPAHAADDFVTRAVAAAVDGRTSRLGRALSSLGVRYVAMPVRDAPQGTRFRPPPGTADALGAQLDLNRLNTDGGLVLYENAAWVPARADLAGRDRPLPTTPADPLRSTVDTPLRGAEPLGDASVPAGTVLLSEAYDGGWHAEAPAGQLEHRPAFGVVNQFDHPRASTVDVGHDGQGRRYLLVAGQVALWLLALGWWGSGRRRRRPPPPARVRDVADRPARLPDDPFLDDDYWTRS